VTVTEPSRVRIPPFDHMEVDLGYILADE